MLSAPRFVSVTSFRPNQVSKHWLSHDLTPFRETFLAAVQIRCIALWAAIYDDTIEKNRWTTVLKFMD